MASTFTLWEVDPFFAAAEDVQQSADRMESAHRAWKRDSSEGVDTKAAELSKRELLTAFDTCRWQLEEFRKAVTKASHVKGLQLGEEATKRHLLFIEAIENLINTTETTFRESIDLHASVSRHPNGLNNEERDQLAIFLSGFPSGKSHRSKTGEHDDISEKVGLTAKKIAYPFKDHSTRNGYKRWKNGFHGDVAREDNVKTDGIHRLQVDIDEGQLGDGASDDFKISRPSGALGTWTREQCRYNWAAARNPLSRKSIVVIVGFCLCCLYLYSLSNLVPYKSALFPHKF